MSPVNLSVIVSGTQDKTYCPCSFLPVYSVLIKDRLAYAGRCQVQAQFSTHNVVPSKVLVIPGFPQPRGWASSFDIQNQTMTSNFASLALLDLSASASKNMSMATFVARFSFFNVCTSVDSAGVSPNPYVQCRSRSTWEILFISFGNTSSTRILGYPWTGAV
jgi:hypothetical protein